MTEETPCHRCGGTSEPLWDDGEENGETVYLCQDCHEAEVDASSR